MAKFEGQERRMPGINACLKEYGMNTLEDARDLTLEHGINVGRSEEHTSELQSL